MIKIEKNILILNLIKNTLINFPFIKKIDVKIIQFLKKYCDCFVK